MKRLLFLYCFWIAPISISSVTFAMDENNNNIILDDEPEQNSKKKEKEDDKSSEHNRRDCKQDEIEVCQVLYEMSRYFLTDKNHHNNYPFVVSDFTKNNCGNPLFSTYSRNPMKSPAIIISSSAQNTSDIALPFPINCNNNNYSSSNINNINSTRNPAIAQSDGEVDVDTEFELRILKRLNGNQPWTLSCVSPPKMGKMRKLEMQFRNVTKTFHLSIQITLICDNGNSSSLVISETNRRYKKSKKSEETSLATYIIIPSSEPIMKIIYLKPTWGSFGPRKVRPSFKIQIIVTDPLTKKSQILHSWNTEIHCHKMESSLDGTLIDDTYPASIFTTHFTI